MRFQIDFGKVWGGFGERFRTSLASLGALLSVFFQGFVAKRTQEGPRGGQETSWARFSMVLDRFWEGFARPKWLKHPYFCYFFDLLCET